MYVYDFGDNWEHFMTVKGRADPADVFVCLSGTSHPATEDVGSYNGWNDLKAAYHAARPIKKQRRGMRAAAQVGVKAQSNKISSLI